jgi:folate-binding protein YgfZ
VLVDTAGAWLALTAGDGAAERLALDRVLFPADQVELGPLRPGRWLRVIGRPLAPPGPWSPLEGGGGWWLGHDLLLLADTPVPEALAALPRLSARDAELWRLGQGEPSWPAELNEAFNAFELGLADRVSLSKGCYVGQETLAKLASADGVKQQLRRWWQAPDPSLAPALEPGAALRTAAGTRAGQITSLLHLEDHATVGLAMVRRQALEEDTLWAAAGEAWSPVRLSRPMGFQDPPKPKPSPSRPGRRLLST